MTVKNFRKTIYDYYAKHGRDLPWRRTNQSYHILVSEIMLQQTQVPRVIEKYSQFIRTFPTLETLAQAPLKKIMREWQGLGYNRRALLLQRLAQAVVNQYAGRIPQDRETLKTLPGIGEATSGALCAFAFNKPVVFIETNIRSVFIHHFFKDKKKVSDVQLIPYIEKTLDRHNPRRWYSALMDYGVYLKDQMPNPGRKSAHYTRQSPFKGSNRQIRGAILRELLKHKKIREERLYRLFLGEKARVRTIVVSLQREGFIVKRGSLLYM